MHTRFFAELSSIRSDLCYLYVSRILYIAFSPKACVHAPFLDLSKSIKANFFKQHQLPGRMLTHVDLRFAEDA